ncbi:hypothetical protein ABIE56_002414 [Luteibacter sp. 621]|uniref:DNA-binding protein n=1 Tax=Luteibacter sp. 621 TaxID=3373916 RepID=UPI003D22CC55
MARGITEQDVHQAAYDLVIAGERPTVERIRAHLGTGSPNTVIRHLDSWWLALATRLGEEGGKAPLPDAPAALARLAGEWWDVAMREATDHAAARLADAHAALAAERTALDDRERLRVDEFERMEADIVAAQPGAKRRARACGGESLSRGSGPRASGNARPAERT